MSSIAMTARCNQTAGCHRYARQSQNPLLASILLLCSVACLLADSWPTLSSTLRYPPLQGSFMRLSRCASVNGYRPTPSSRSLLLSSSVCFTFQSWHSLAEKLRPGRRYTYFNLLHRGTVTFIRQAYLRRELFKNFSSKTP